MVGRPQRKVFCQGFTRAGRRIGKLIPCGMKGYELANGTFYCKYHGYQNVKGFKKKNYTDQTRIKQLSKLKQFKNYSNEQLQRYYENRIKPSITDGTKSTYYRRKTRKRIFSPRNSIGQAVSVQLDEVLSLLKKKSKLGTENNGS